MKTSQFLCFCLLMVGIGGCKTTQNSGSLASVSGDDFAPIDYAHVHKVDVLGIPFGDTVLNEFDTARNIGANNLYLQDDFVLRFVHLAEQLGPELEMMGFQTCLDYTPGAPQSPNYRNFQSGPNSPIYAKSAFRVASDFWKARECFLQRVRFPDNVKWRTPRSTELKPPRVISLFLPNVLTVYLDSNGTWPFGRRPNDDMIGRFNSLFLKMGNHPGDCSGSRDLNALRRNGAVVRGDDVPYDTRCSLESLSQRSNGAQVAKFTGWGGKVPAVPINTAHEIKLADGTVKRGFEEERFPFLWPPNDGPGYYQTGQSDIDDVSGEEQDQIVGDALADVMPVGTEIVIASNGDRTVSCGFGKDSATATIKTIHSLRMTLRADRSTVDTKIVTSNYVGKNVSPAIPIATRELKSWRTAIKSRGMGQNEIKPFMEALGMRGRTPPEFDQDWRSWGCKIN